MGFHYFQRNSGIPLILKIGLLALALYLTYFFFKLFAIVLTALFAVFKVVLFIGFLFAVAAVLLKFLFGVNVFPFNRQNLRYHRR